MKTVAGIFQDRTDAERAVAALREAGVADRRISLLTPGTAAQDFDAQVPTTETEQPGMGKALGGVVGGALGAAGGLSLGAAAASLLIPGVGPVLAVGMIGAALFGAGGAAAGAAAGNLMEDNIATGLPHDELFVYEDALRRGRTLVVAVVEDDEQEERTERMLEAAGAESVDAAREQWWIGLRDAESEEYATAGRDFSADEPDYRRGFEAALHPRSRGVTFDESRERLRECYGEECERAAFRSGYDRGQTHQRSLAERQDL
ncbi:MAG: hypothetical protein ACRD9R_11855 [Pyrinomonadaceae bacterium]